MRSFPWKVLAIRFALALVMGLLALGGAAARADDREGPRCLLHVFREERAQEAATRQACDALVMAWPVAAKRRVNIGFHDPRHPASRRRPHKGVDIRARQGTTVVAAADGVVVAARRAGLRYSFVAISHNGVVTTVYGHLSRILVKLHAVVRKGQAIGKSGGKPGTPGSGHRTTGPHLHFETRVNGVPADPMRFFMNW